MLRAILLFLQVLLAAGKTWSTTDSVDIVTTGRCQSPILTEALCRAAAKRNGKAFSWASAKTTWPPGCWHASYNNKYYFNRLPQASKPCSSKEKCICDTRSTRYGCPVGYGYNVELTEGRCTFPMTNIQKCHDLSKRRRKSFNNGNRRSTPSAFYNDDPYGCIYNSKGTQYTQYRAYFAFNQRKAGSDVCSDRFKCYCEPDKCQRCQLGQYSPGGDKSTAVCKSSTKKYIQYEYESAVYSASVDTCPPGYGIDTLDGMKRCVSCMHNHYSQGGINKCLRCNEG